MSEIKMYDSRRKSQAIASAIGKICNAEASIFSRPGASRDSIRGSLRASACTGPFFMLQRRLRESSTQALDKLVDKIGGTLKTLSATIGYAD